MGPAGSSASISNRGAALGPLTARHERREQRVRAVGRALNSGCACVPT